MSVSASLQGEQYQVDPHEKIQVLTDFDQCFKYKYVTIDLKLDTDINNNVSGSPTDRTDAFAKIMETSRSTKCLELLDMDKPRFNGMHS